MEKVDVPWHVHLEEDQGYVSLGASEVQAPLRPPVQIQAMMAG
jgi:hypothetical protein